MEAIAKMLYTCGTCCYRSDRRICTHPDSPYIGCIVNVKDWCGCYLTALDKVVRGSDNGKKFEGKENQAKRLVR
jgi:hypothetical protein